MNDAHVGASAPLLSVVLPTFNEADGIVAFVRALRTALNEAGITHEIRVVDDASPDGTADRIREAFGDAVDVTVREPPRGLAASLLQGIRAARGEFVLLMDSDFNHKPVDVPRLLAGCAHADLVVGSRFVSGGGMPHAPARALLSRAFNRFVRTALQTPVRDHLSGFLCVRRAALLALPLDDIFIGYGDFCIRLLHTAHRRGMRISEVPVRYGVRPSGASNTRFVHHGIRYARVVFLLREADRHARHGDPSPTRMAIENAVPPATALLFHDPRWLGVMADAYRLEPHHLAANAPDGSAMLPLFLARSPLFGRRLVSQPFNFFGGLAGNSDAAALAVLEAARALREHKRARYVEIRNVDPLPRALVERLDLIERKPMLRFSVPLEGSDDAFEQRRKPQFRTNLRALRQRAADAGIAIETVAAPDRAMLRDFHDLLTDEYRKKHFMIVQPFALFAKLAAAFGDEFRLVAAKRDGRMIGGAIVLRANNVDNYMWGAFDLREATFSPLTLVVDAGIAQARAAGMATFDLGVTSPTHHGLIFSKSRWGSDCAPLHYYYLAGSEGDVPALDYHESFRAARSLIRFVPRRLVQSAAAWVVPNWLA